MKRWRREKMTLEEDRMERGRREKVKNGQDARIASIAGEWLGEAQPQQQRTSCQSNTHPGKSSATNATKCQE